MATVREEFQFIDDAALSIDQAPECLVEGILPCGALGVVVGPPASAKTFLVLDLALSVASGTDWLGQCPVKQGPVVYVAAEGSSRSLGLRVEAWKAFHRVREETVGVQFLLQPVQLHTRSEREKLLDAIEDQLAVPPALVVVDPLARCFLGGEENSAKDMGLLIAGMDALRGTGATVLAVHHAGHNKQIRERGSSALRAAVDTMMTITRDGTPGGLYTVRCAKQKDDEPFGDLQLKLRPQIVRDGEGSRVLELVSRAADGGQRRPDELRDRAARALAVLRSLGTKGATHGEWLKASGLPKATFNRALSDLLTHEMVARVGDRYVPTSP
jgi:hypothetical protein